MTHSCMFHLFDGRARKSSSIKTVAVKLDASCLGALWVVAQGPEVLLDVCGDLHHVGPHPDLHLPV